MRKNLKVVVAYTIRIPYILYSLHYCSSESIKQEFVNSHTAQAKIFNT